GTCESWEWEVANLHLQAKRDGVVGAKFDAAPGGLFHGGDDPAAHVGLERVGGHVPGGGAQEDDSSEEDDQEIFPPAAARGAGRNISHCPWPPEAVDGLEPATVVRILLSARRD